MIYPPGPRVQASVGVDLARAETAALIAQLDTAGDGRLRWDAHAIAAMR
jgi:hypothetical protein